MHRNSSVDQAVRIKVLLSPARHSASLKCYCPFLHLFYDYFASVTCCITERARIIAARSPRCWNPREIARESGKFVSIGPSGGRPRRKTLWSTRRMKRVFFSWPLVGGATCVSVKVLRVFLSRCPTSADPRGRTTRGWRRRPMIARHKNHAIREECDRNANVRLDYETLPWD